MTTERDVCKLCQNHCKLTITTFSDGSRFVTGNRCERGGDAKKKRSDRPNLYDYKYKRCFAYRRLTDKAATRGEIGIPRALNMYENYPFWFTLLTSLGFKVMISGRSSSHELFETGIESIASENICYPAKLVHGHIKWLLDKGVKTIFYPCVSYEENLVPNTDNHYNCPVVANYPLVVGANMPELREDGVRYMHPYFNLANHELMVDRILEEFAWANVTREEVETAVKAAYAEDKVFKHDVQQEGLTALAYMKEHNCRGIVLAGRPYHIDPEINHGIPETICSLGMVVLSEDSICELQPGEKLDLTEFLSEGEADPRSKNAARIPPRRRPHRSPRCRCASPTSGPTTPVCTRPHTSCPRIRASNSCSSTPSAAVSTPSPPIRWPRSWPTRRTCTRCSRLTRSPTWVPPRFDCARSRPPSRNARRTRRAWPRPRSPRPTSPVPPSPTPRATRLTPPRRPPPARRRSRPNPISPPRRPRSPKRRPPSPPPKRRSRPPTGPWTRPMPAATPPPPRTRRSPPDSARPAPRRPRRAVRSCSTRRWPRTRSSPRRCATRPSAPRSATSPMCVSPALGDGTTNDAANAKSKSAKSKSGHNNATMSRYAHREKFVKDMKKDYTIVAPQMSPIHFSLVESVIRSGGYKFDILKHASREDVETGLKYVNNDACYPAIMVIGQLIDAILEGKYDPDKVCLAITQTGGMCRATNYFGLIRKALIDAGYPQIPVIAISTQGLEDNPGFKVTPALLHRTVKALILGDLLMKCLYRVRPYEVEKGSANTPVRAVGRDRARGASNTTAISKTAAKTPWHQDAATCRTPCSPERS